MTGTRKSTADYKAENKRLRDENASLRAANRAGVAASIIQPLMKYGCYAYIANCGYKAIAALAGQATTANIIVKFFSNFTVSNGLCLTAAGAGIGYGVVQKRLSARTIRRLGHVPGELESEKDPNRTSSELMESGETRPEDENDN